MAGPMTILLQCPYERISSVCVLGNHGEIGSGRDYFDKDDKVETLRTNLDA